MTGIHFSRAKKTTASIIPTIRRLHLVSDSFLSQLAYSSRCYLIYLLHIYILFFNFYIKKYV